ncbi:MAG: hypothetical protein OXN81_02900 [Alphaproteobacteria bacterium]|nr:hypothetical protein [Alphaproteobacteria bacterium]
MNRIPHGFIAPSAAFSVSPRLMQHWMDLNRIPHPGDLVYGRVLHVGEHNSLENRHGRIHMIADGSRAVFVFGARYAPDAFEGRVPERRVREADLLARSGIVGLVRTKNSLVKDPTTIEILGHVVDREGSPLNTRDHPLAIPRRPLRRDRQRAKMILNVGTAMNSGKTTSAIACCRALAGMGYAVRASKVTGTASLKDILHMQDAGAESVSDFTSLGFPSTYLLEEHELFGLFENLDAKYANNPAKFWVVELSDGILQRETAMLLQNVWLRSRIHRLVFSAADVFGALGGIQVLRDRFGLVPDAISGRCSSSPLLIRELRDQSDIPVFDNVRLDLRQLGEILLPGKAAERWPRELPDRAIAV